MSSREEPFTQFAKGKRLFLAAKVRFYLLNSIVIGVLASALLALLITYSSYITEQYRQIEEYALSLSSLKPAFQSARRAGQPFFGAFTIINPSKCSGAFYGLGESDEEAGKSLLDLYFKSKGILEDLERVCSDYDLSQKAYWDVAIEAIDSFDASSADEAQSRFKVCDFKAQSVHIREEMDGYVDDIESKLEMLDSLGVSIRAKAEWSFRLKNIFGLARRKSKAPIT